MIWALQNVLYVNETKQKPCLTFNLFQLELILNKADGGDISSCVPNGEWDLIGE